MPVAINNGRLVSAGSSRSGFSLIELLVVLVIVGMLAVFTLPAIKNVRQGNALVSAGRQLVDDLARARNRAIADQTTVYFVFINLDILSLTFNVNTAEGKLGERLKSGAFTTYAFFSERSVGDQPGARQPRYLRDGWQSLPDGVLVETNKLIGAVSHPEPHLRALRYRTEAFPFPTSDSTVTTQLRCIAFDHRGRVVDPDDHKRVLTDGEVIPLTRGSILYARDAAGNLLDAPDVREIVPEGDNYHHVVIDGLTGRARVDTKAIY
jgi:prepilin-type N-terminal cleavage/methylation domain-containing protein